MRKNHQPQSGRFNPRIAAALVLGLAGTCLAMLSFAAPSTQAPVAGIASAGPTVIPSEFSGDVRSLPQTITDAERESFSGRPELERPPLGAKQVLPGTTSLAPPSPDLFAITAPMPNPSITFDGLNYDLNGAGHPPDTVGDVGPNPLVQVVNTSVDID